SLVKGEKIKTVLFFVICGSILVGTSYLLDGSGINGAAALYLGAAQALINYFFDVKKKPIPRWLIALYAVAIVVLNIWVAGQVTGLGLLVIVASLTFIFCIGQTDGTGYRLWMIVNLSLWCLYDVLAQAYSPLLTHGVLFLFNVIGILIHDRKKKS
ncbi:MAG: YgjV family protein, partial [Ruminococcaceae bacterium]|nr:YgjV family protein [Oscillospiraceae bacterium]